MEVKVELNFQYDIISLLLIMFCLFLLVWCLLVCESGAEVGIRKEKVCVCVCMCMLWEERRDGDGIHEKGVGDF